MSNFWENRARIVYVLVAVGSALATLLITALLTNIFERRQEERHTFTRLVEVTEDTVDATEWGKNWPRQYDGYRRTEEASNTKYGGAVVNAEGGMPAQKADNNPWLRRIFAGYLFSVDFRERRGHAHMLSDQQVTKRNVRAEAKQSGNCLHCHSSIMPLYRKLGREALPEGSPDEQISKGLDLVGEMSYWDAHDLLEETTGGPHPVSCVDCHDPGNMELRVTRPAFIAGMQALAEGDGAAPHLPSVERWREGDRSHPYDPNEDASRQEMRSFVCGQCHVEYFCAGGATIFFPWGDGLTVENIEQNFNERQIKGRRFRDFVHAETGMDILKAQHPEFEVWAQGIHSMSGVACTDCHMPYMREGALKVSEHWVRSPLLMVNRSCGTCHAYGEDELRGRVERIQDRHHALLQRAADAAISMLDAIVAVRRQHEDQHREEVRAEVRASKAGQSAESIDEVVELRLRALWQKAVDEDPRLHEIGELQRASAWRLDFVTSENSMGFHAPQEMARILAESIDLARQAEIMALTSLEGRGAPPASENEAEAEAEETEVGEAADAGGSVADAG